MDAKRLKLHDPSSSSTTLQTTDWTLCVLCQQRSTELLRDPVQGKSGVQAGKSYDTLAKNLKDLHDLNSLPMNIDLGRLDDGIGLEETLLSHQAKYHKTCYVNCNREKVERIQKKIAKAEALASEKLSPIKGKLRGAYPCSTSLSDDQQGRWCFFCDKPIGDEYHTAMTPKLDSNVRKMATEMRDSKLLAKLSSGDMTATDAVYHKRCLTELSTKHRSLTRHRDSLNSSEGMNPHAIAFAELVSYVEDIREADSETPILKLSELVALYKSRLEQLGADTSSRTNSTRLKEKLLAEIPGLEAHRSSYEVILSFKESTGDLLKSSQRNPDSDAVILMRAAQIVRKEILDTQYKFQGSLLDEKYDDLPSSLVALIQMILAGTNIESQTETGKDVNAATSSITQLLTFNAIKRSRKDTQAVRHNPDRETRLPLYLGLLVYTKTRKRELVDTLFQHGLSVSYSRITQLSTQLANSVLDQYEADGTVCPTALRGGLFTTSNLDNIDHNPSSTSVNSSFHGTAISMTQHPTDGIEGTDRTESTPMLANEVSRVLKSLPEAYVQVPPAKYPNENPPVRAYVGNIPKRSSSMTYDERHKSWLKKINT
jgi:hypothetical protein